MKTSRTNWKRRPGRRAHESFGLAQSVALLLAAALAFWLAPEVTHAVIAWPKGEPDRATGLLYKLTWENPRPDVGVERIDYVSNRTSAAPFLIAITAEPE
ncbi:MAG: hypothetical protein FJ398_09050 [Verrucomicrobia bacterium]|nr:hypothetical protein [Verrucomicrobiota bacterium]